MTSKSIQDDNEGFDQKASNRGRTVKTRCGLHIYAQTKKLFRELLFQLSDLCVGVIAFGTEIELDLRLCSGRTY